jgi:hypothetical protein
MKPYRPGEPKISKAHWERLNTFFQGIERPAQDQLYATGDHYTPLAPEGSHRALHTFLTRQLGERIPETRGAVYAVAAAYMRRHETAA